MVGPIGRAMLGLALVLVALGVPPAPARAAALVTVHGTVIDQFGSPVAGVEVSVGEYDRIGFSPSVRVQTDTQGRYRLRFDPDDLWLEQAGMRAWKYGYVEDYGDTGYLTGRTYTVDFAVRERLPISGTVVDESGGPVAGVKVTMNNTLPGGECPGYHYELECTGPRDFVATTDAAGNYSSILHGGEFYSLVFTADGYATEVVHDVAPGARVDVHLTSGEPDVAPVSVTGVVSSATGDPLPGVTVVAGDHPHSTVHPDIGHSIYATSQTDGSGRYHLWFDPLAIKNFESGVVVSANADGVSVSWPVGEIRLGRYYEPGTTFEVDIPLGPPATITGVIRDPEGMPAEGAMIGGAVTDADGRYTLGVHPGLYGFRVYHASGSFFAAGVVNAGQEVEHDIALVPRRREPAPDETVPAKPRRVTARAVSPWRAKVVFRPGYDGERPITGYQASCRNPRGLVRRATGTASPIVVKRLEPDRSYRCRVRARNALGWGAWAYAPRFRTPERSD